MNPLTDMPQILFGLAWSNNSKMVGLTLIDKFQAKMVTQVGLLIVFKNDRKNDRFSFRSNFFTKNDRFVFGKNDSFGKRTTRFESSKNE